MKKMLLILAIASMICSCNATPTDFIDSTSTIVEEKIDTITFSYSNFIEMTYLDEDEVAIIRYDDPDVFDYETLAFITGRDTWYGEYIECVVDETILDDFVYNKQNYENTNDFWRKELLNNQYIIVEHLIRYLDGTIDAIYNIELNEEESSK